MRITLLGAALVLWASSAQAAQIVLTPADVIDTSGAYSAQFSASNILDHQTGPVFEGNSGAQQGYWLNPDNGPANAYITVDLGKAYTLSELTLFNTHNDKYNDRGTGNFSILAGNKADFSDLTTLLVNGTLAPASSSNEPIPGQDFAVGNTGSFRYLKFEPTSVASSGTPCCGANNYGLNELRVFAADAVAVPEPASMTLLGLGVCSLLGRAAWRRKQA